jgi:hypothetical protein
MENNSVPVPPATLTKQQRDNLLLAIDRAEGFGACTYVKDGKPLCVIAQLAAIEGVPVELMCMWGNQSVYGIALPPALQAYDGFGFGAASFLRKVQRCWDLLPALNDPDFDIAERRKQKMRDLVEQAYAAGGAK